MSEVPEYDYIRAILSSLEQALVRRMGSVELVRGEIGAVFGSSAHEVERWHDEPWRVPLSARRILAILANRAAADVEVEADEAVGIQLRVLTARQMAAHMVAIQARHGNHGWPSGGIEINEFMAAMRMIPAPSAPAVDETQRARFESAILAQDDADLEMLLRRMDPAS